MYFKRKIRKYIQFQGPPWLISQYISFETCFYTKNGGSLAGGRVVADTYVYIYGGYIGVALFPETADPVADSVTPVLQRQSPHHNVTHNRSHETIRAAEFIMGYLYLPNTYNR